MKKGPVTIDGVEYPNLQAASIVLGISTSTAAAWAVREEYRHPRAPDELGVGTEVYVVVSGVFQRHAGVIVRVKREYVAIRFLDHPWQLKDKNGVWWFHVNEVVAK